MSSVEKFNNDNVPLMTKAYMAAIKNMGQDDAFKKNESDLLSLLN
jgi:hypothetical protein